MGSDDSSTFAVSVGSERLRLLSEVYEEYFQEYAFVRLGAHHELPLIYIRLAASMTDETYVISDRRYDAFISCQRFLRANNYHHTETQQYRAQWVDAVDALVVDLSDPISEC